MKTTVGLVDDHQLFIKSLSMMLDSFEEYDVIVEALNGKDLQQKLSALNVVPEIMLIDVNMPVMDGVATAAWLSEHYPAMKLIALSMNDKDTSVIKMFKAGCCSYLLKDAHPAELEKALNQVREKGYYNSETGQLNFGRLLMKAEGKPEITVSAKELQFLKLACSDLTYKEIAGMMNLAERTIDGYRESLFQKFGVQSRVGLCLEALRKEFVTL
ncbi:response regulator transcription factor [Chitinophaga tropicalis]|uniref:Response regulator n=1 Tax=Chitinophaga tropicalis TaxID=2683588 RepID=A0A7K1U600_9BACT|nr:response regulator transcription factor [Chitinophaga tropicalis]MVT09385.1 response regulator [Chitinophaga tropicalis]